MVTKVIKSGKHSEWDPALQIALRVATKPPKQAGGAKHGRGEDGGAAKDAFFFLCACARVCVFF